MKNVEMILKKMEKEYKKGFLSFMVLFFLYERPMYGYEIQKRLEGISDRMFTFRDSGIYQVFKKQKGTGLIRSETKKSEKGPNRKYYSLTPRGREVLVRYVQNYIIPTHRTIDSLLKKSELINEFK